jgi:hypothetical protein
MIWPGGAQIGSMTGDQSYLSTEAADVTHAVKSDLNDSATCVVV